MAKKGQKSWNSGTSNGWTDKRGYRWIYVEENGKRRAKREHRHIMELHLGRKLSPEEIVHHKDGNCSNNVIENLSLTTWAEHTANHHNGSKRTDEQKKRMEVLASYREENRRLKEVNAELLEALKDISDRATIFWLNNNMRQHKSDGIGALANQIKTIAETAIAKAEGTQ